MVRGVAMPAKRSVIAKYVWRVDHRQLDDYLERIMHEPSNGHVITPSTP
jgi:hypothetical protein